MKILPIAVLLAILAAPADGGVQEDAATPFQSHVLPILQSRCAKCHGSSKAKANVVLDGTRGLDRLSGEGDLWFRVRDQIQAGQMPPPEETPLQPAEREKILAWIRGEFTDLVAAKRKREGRRHLRRLTRSEYSNTLEDLLGIRPPLDALPQDGRVDGYEKVGSALPLTPEGALSYLNIAEYLMRSYVLKPNAPDASRTIRSVAKESEQSKGHILELGDGTMVSFNSDVTSGPFKNFSVQVPGVYRVRVSVYAYQSEKPLPFGIYVGSTWSYPQQLEFAGLLEAPPGKATVLETEIYLREGSGARLIPFGLGVPVPKNSQASQCRGPGLAVQWIEAVEPERPLKIDRWLTADFPRPLSEELRSQNGQVVLKQAKSVNRAEFLSVMQATFKRIGARFYRRDLTSSELQQIVNEIARQIDTGVPLAAAFQSQVVDLMTSPDFFCVIEAPGPLRDVALASRLSYFLWNSTPDERLLDTARKGRLRDPKVLRDETERLLKDPKSERFVKEFVDQWLGLNAIHDTTPDAKLYPEYGRNELIKYSSVWETQGFFRRVLMENLGVRAFVDAPWAYINEPLARHYGLPEVSGASLRAVTLPESSPFGGLWTQSAVLKVTANGTATSPVKRGVWVARRLLGIDIPPPPPTVTAIEPDTRGAKTLREQLELHRNNPSCAACHARFDPYGFALESFDVTGGLRTQYRVADSGRTGWREGPAVDPSGTTPEGAPFRGIVELRRMLARNPQQIATGVTRHLVTYATGAPATPADQKAVDAVVQSASADNYGLRTLLHSLIDSDLFRWK